MYVCVCVYVCDYEYIHVLCICICIQTCVYVYLCMWECVFVYAICMYAYMYVRKYTYVHTSIRTCMQTIHQTTHTYIVQGHMHQNHKLHKKTKTSPTINVPIATCAPITKRKYRTNHLSQRLSPCLPKLPCNNAGLKLHSTATRECIPSIPPTNTAGAMKRRAWEKKIKHGGLVSFMVICV